MSNGPREAWDMERPLAEAQDLISALRMCATHSDVPDHHQGAFNVLANAIGDRLQEVERLRCACLQRGQRAIA